MGDTTKIQWTATVHPDGTITPGKTWNPWQGCTKVSPGCARCYMYRDKAHYGQDPTVVVRSKTTFTAPLKWAEPAKVFTCSWSDFFHEAADAWRADAWDIIRQTPHLTYQILTKRPERLAACLPPDWGTGWPHVWLGTSVENQHFADTRIPILLNTPAAVRFLSCEPLLGPLDLQGPLAPSTIVRCAWLLKHGVSCPPTSQDTGLHWVIIGGESGGQDARRMALIWAARLLLDCENAGVAAFVKQLGSVWAREHQAHDSHGGDMAEWPAALRVRQFPEVRA